MSSLSTQVMSGARAALDPRWLGGRGRLAQSLRLEENGPSRLTLIAIAALSGALALFLAWSSVTRLGEVTPASGEVTPVGSVKRVQHLEGGIIAAIHIREGDMVEQGQALMELEGGTTAPDLEQLHARLAGLRLQEARLLAQTTNEKVKIQTTDPRFNGMAQAQDALLTGKREAHASEEAVLRHQVAERHAELDTATAQAVTVRQQISVLEEQIRVRRELVEKGYSARMTLLDQERELARVQTQLAEIEGQMRKSHVAITEAEGRIADLRTHSQLDAAQEIGKVRGDIAELTEAITRAQDRVDRLVVRAPVRGIVKGMQSETVGGVVPSGSTLLEIVPVDAKLIVEARIPTKDIGYVKIGQETLVKVGTYDYARFGGIEGKIDSISATTFRDEKGMPFYRARIRLNQNYVGDDAERNLVMPGMTVIADIRTGQKTVLQYLLKPVMGAVNESLREH